MLVGAGVRFGGQPMRTMGGVTAGSVERARWQQPGNLRNVHAGEATVIGGASISDRNGQPSGYLHPRSWSMPTKGGGLAMRADATGTMTASGAAGYGMSASLTGAAAMSAGLTGAFAAVCPISVTTSLLVAMSADGSMVAAIVATGALTASPTAAAGMATAMTAAGTLSASASAAAGMSSAMAATATMTGEGAGAAGMVAALSGSATLTPIMVGAYLAHAALSGSGTLAVGMSALASVSAPMTVSGSLTAFLTALGNMELDIAQTTEEISPDAIASAVWSHGAALSLIDAVELVRRITDNRLEVDIAGQRLVLYADDGTTEIREWALSTDGGEDVATATGVQTKRGAPA